MKTKREIEREETMEQATTEAILNDLTSFRLLSRIFGYRWTSRRIKYQKIVGWNGTKHGNKIGYDSAGDCGGKGNV